MNEEMPPFPFGELPPLNDRPVDDDGLPHWLAAAESSPSESEARPEADWPNSAVGGLSKLLPGFEPSSQSKEDDTLSNYPQPPDDLPPLAPLPDQSVPTERIRSKSLQRQLPSANPDLPLPPPFSAGLSELSPFLPPKVEAPAAPIIDSQTAPTLTRTPPPAQSLDIPPASAIWRTRRISVVPQFEENGEVAVYRTVVRDEAGRGYVSAKVTFPLPSGIKQVQASRKPTAKKGLLHWNLGALGPTDSIALSVKIPTHLLGSTESAAAPRSFEVIYQPLPGAKLVGELKSPASVSYGEPFTVEMRVSNQGELATGDVTVRVADRTSGRKPVVVTLPAIAPNESRTATINLVSQVDGQHNWLCTVESHGCETVESIFTTKVIRPTLQLAIKHNSTARIDEEESFTLVVTNDAPVAARGIAAQLTVPEEFTFASAPNGKYDRSLNLVGWTIGDIPAGESRTVVANLRGFAPGFIGIQGRVESLSGSVATATSNVFVEIDARATSSTLDKLLAAIEMTIPDDIVEDRVREIETGARHIVFEMAGTHYAVPIENVREVLRPNRPTRVPGTPEWLPGVTNIRGDIVSVVDLPRFLGVADQDKESRGLLIAQTSDGQITVGLLVNEIVGIRQLIPSQNVNRDQLQNPIVDYIDSIAEHGSHLIPIMRLDALIRSTELNSSTAI